MFKCSERDCYLKDPFSKSFHEVKNVIIKVSIVYPFASPVLHLQDRTPPLPSISAGIGR